MTVGLDGEGIFVGSTVGIDDVGGEVGISVGKETVGSLVGRVVLGAFDGSGDIVPDRREHATSRVTVGAGSVC